MTGLFTTMILGEARIQYRPPSNVLTPRTTTPAANAASPTISTALLDELRSSQPQLLQRLSRSVPGMLPKAYRWAGEMQEVAAYVGGPEREIYEGLSRLYRRVERALESDGREGGDVRVLMEFAERAKEALERGV